MLSVFEPVELVFWFGFEDDDDDDDDYGMDRYGQVWYLMSERRPW